MTPIPPRRWTAELSIDPEPDPGAFPPLRLPRGIKGEIRFPTHPILCAVDDLVLRAYPWALPFADGAFDQITCRNGLEFVVDDAAFIAEMARVLRPGGRLVLTVPAAGPLAGFDAMNLYKYLCDVTGRGPRLAESRELGWRRHYAERDIVHLVEDRFTIMTRRHHRLIVAELAHLIALIWHRWLGVDRAGYAFARYRVERIAVHEDGVGSAIGFMLTLVLERRATPDRHLLSQTAR